MKIDIGIVIFGMLIYVIIDILKIETRLLAFRLPRGEKNRRHNK